MRILVVGAGALGSFLAGVLNQENEVTLFARKAPAEAIEKDGLVIEGETKRTTQLNVAQTADEISSVDFNLVIIAVKSYDTEEAVKNIKSLVDKKTAVLSLQNGLDNEEKIAAQFGGDRTLGGVTSHGVTLLEYGRVVHAGLGETKIGELDGKDTNRVHDICKIFTSAGIKTDLSDNIYGEIWAKGIVNAGINPLTATLRVPNGHLLEHEYLTSMLEKICNECINVANAAHVKLPDCDLIEKTKNVARLTAKNKSSMLQDIERKRKTEIDSINGAIVRIGEEYGVPTPVNSTLVRLVKGIERSYGLKE